MATSPERLSAILRGYSDLAQQLESHGELDDHAPDPGPATALYEASVERTLRLLRDKVQGQEAVLTKLRQSAGTDVISEPSPDPARRLIQLRAITAAYESLESSQPDLPSPDSPLPALLALRNTHSLITNTKASISTVQAALVQAEGRLEKEKADVRDALSITKALESRIADLTAQQREASKRTPQQTAKDLIKQRQARKVGYERGLRSLVKAFNAFIDEHLAAMLAAEELGGPVVGEMTDLEDDMLEAGFSHQGTARKAKSTMTDMTRQRRIDQIWGQEEQGGGDQEDGARSERGAAGAEMRALAEELLNASVVSGASGSGAYVELHRDSAAARFLVRAKVAQFHPKDARRLRLLDFGRELDD